MLMGSELDATTVPAQPEKDKKKVVDIAFWRKREKTDLWRTCQEENSKQSENLGTNPRSSSSS